MATSKIILFTPVIYVILTVQLARLLLKLAINVNRLMDGITIDVTILAKLVSFMIIVVDLQTALLVGLNV